MVLYRFARVWSVNRNCWLLASAGITKRLVARFSRLCLVTTLAPPPTLSLVNRVLYHQPYRASSHWVECDKNPILLWFKWINIPSACLFCAWLWGRMDIVKLVIYSAWFSCKTRMHLGCILLFMMNATVPYWFCSLSWCSSKTLKRANENWKHRLCISLHPDIHLMKG